MPSAALLQIRRYVYCDVVRATDMSPHVDISGIQVCAGSWQKEPMHAALALATCWWRPAAACSCMAGC